MIEQDYRLLGNKPRRIKSSDEHVGARRTPLGYAARLKQKIPCRRAARVATFEHGNVSHPNSDRTNRRVPIRTMMSCCPWFPATLLSE